MKIKALAISLVTALMPVLMSATTPASDYSSEPRKRDFRGAWLHTVYQPQYLAQNTGQNKRYLTEVLDSLESAGINAVIFQVRPSADAFYNSTLEPWSRFLTKDGKAPSPYWDPLEFIITEAHNRNMELHAWLNPYRVTTSKNERLSPSHIYHRHPERFVSYEGKLYFDPGQPENRRFIADVVKDIVTRYDIDAIHFDDYFYPYPGKTAFPDDASYDAYGHGRDRGDWRRANVDSLIREVNTVIKTAKPWVRFGISPFGIWRNKSSDPDGSDTGGLQNYDDLYADVMLWAREGWIDYLAPQLYWNMEHPKASYTVLAEWWDSHTPPDTRLYFGQDVSRTMSAPDTIMFNQPTQLSAKLALASGGPNTDGNIWWPGYTIFKNEKGIADSLANVHYAMPALPPAYPELSAVTPQAPDNISFNAGVLSWDAPAPQDRANDAVAFVVYCFTRDEDTFYLDNPGNIAAITHEKQFIPTEPGIYVVTALDRVNNESLPSAPIKITL